MHTLSTDKLENTDCNLSVLRKQIRNPLKKCTYVPAALSVKYVGGPVVSSIKHSGGCKHESQW